MAERHLVPALLGPERKKNSRKKGDRKRSYKATDPVAIRIDKLMDQGYNHDQAMAIAMSRAVPKRKSNSKTKKPRRPNPNNLPDVPAHILNNPEFKKELATFRKRHGDGPVEIFKVKVPKGFPKFMTAYGTSPAALYDAHKKSNKGKRKHLFGDTGKKHPFLVTSQKRGRKFLAYVGGGFRAMPDWLYD